MGNQLTVGGRSLLLDELCFLAAYRSKHAAPKRQILLNLCTTNFFFLSINNNFSIYRTIAHTAHIIFTAKIICIVKNANMLW